MLYTETPGILHIETSTDVCSVAVSEGSGVIYHEERREGHSSDSLGSMVSDALSFADSHAIPLHAVAVSSGPGSYTGLRIGVSMAKGVCFGRDLKLISVPTLQLLCVPVLISDELTVTAGNGAGAAPLPDDALLCPMVDARRMEVYAAVFDRSLHCLRDVQADIVDAGTYLPWLDERPVFFFGNGAGKCKDVITHPNARFVEGIEPLARWMQPLAEKRLLGGQTEDVAYFTPFYLKDFVAKVSRNPLAT